MEAVEAMTNHQTRFGGGGRVVALLTVLLLGTVSWAGAASTATSALMTALMQDPTSPVDPAPPAEDRIRTRPEPTVQENVNRVIATATGGTGDGGTGDGGTGDGGAGGGGLQAGGEPVSVPVQQIFTGTAPGDAFRATSSDESVVTVTVTDNPRVVITPVGPGTATITVSASRPGRQAEIRTRFDVTVGAPGVPALPLVATGVLGMLLFGAGLYRRWRRA